MNKNLKLIKITFFFILISILSFGSTNRNYANAINPIKQQNSLVDFFGEKLNYTFKVSDKLIGTGIIDLALEKNYKGSFVTARTRLRWGRSNLIKIIALIMTVYFLCLPRKH